MPLDGSSEVVVQPGPAAERPDIFLSYSRSDKAAAALIAEQLERKGFVVWWDKGIVSGSDWRAVLDTKIQRARCVMLYWSAEAEKSWWVGYEAMRANQLEKLLIVSFDDVAAKSQSWAKDLQAIRLRRPLFKKFWQTNDWEQLLRDLNHKLPRYPKYEFVGWLGGGVAHANGVTAVEFNPFDDDVILSTGKDGRAVLWSRGAARKELEQIKQENGDDTIAPAQSPSGHFEFAVGADQSGRPWAIQRGAFSYAGDAIVLAAESGTAHVIHGKRFDGERRALSHVSVVSPGHDATQRMVGQNQFSGGVADAAIGPEGLVLTISGGKAILWNWRTGDRREVQLPAYAPGRSVDCCYSAAVQAFFVTDRKGRSHRIDLNGDLLPDALQQRQAPGAVLGFNQFHAGRARGSDLCVASTSPADRTIDIYFANDGTYPDKPDVQTRADYPVRGLAVHPDTKVIAAAAGYRPFLVAWDSGQRVELVGEGGDHFGQLASVAFSASGQYMVAGGDDGCISLWRDTTPRQ
jgi:WD40 repeat protein